MVLIASPSVAIVKSIKGDVMVTHSDKVTVGLKQGDRIFEKDVIKTVANSTVGVVFEDNTLISIGSNSEFSIDEYLFEPANKNVNFKTHLFKGTMACVTGLISKINPEAMEIKAQTVTIGIRGTSFVVEVKE
jgi:hypothetical protein